MSSWRYYPPVGRQVRPTGGEGRLRVATIGGGGGFPGYVADSGDDEPGIFNPFRDDLYDALLRRIEAIRERMPEIFVAKTIAKFAFRLARDTVFPLASDPDEGPPYLTINEAARLVDAIRAIQARQNSAGRQGGVWLSPAFWGQDP